MEFVGERIVEVGIVVKRVEYEKDFIVRMFYGWGRIFMLGLGDVYMYFSWNGGDFGCLGEIDVEEYVFFIIKSV